MLGKIDISSTSSNKIYKYVRDKWTPLLLTHKWPARYNTRYSQKCFKRSVLVDLHEYRHFVEFLWSWHTRRKILSIDMIVIMPSPCQRLFQYYRVTVTLPKALAPWKGMVWRRGLGGSSRTWSNSQQKPPYTYNTYIWQVLKHNLWGGDEDKASSVNPDGSEPCLVMSI